MAEQQPPTQAAKALWVLRQEGLIQDSKAIKLKKGITSHTYEDGSTITWNDKYKEWEADGWSAGRFREWNDPKGVGHYEHGHPWPHGCNGMCSLPSNPGRVPMFISNKEDNKNNA